MADPYDPIWAENGDRVEPNDTEKADGIPCGPLSREMFNWKFWDYDSTFNAIFAREIGAGPGLAGGGPFSENIELATDWSGLAAATTLAADDLVNIRDISASGGSGRQVKATLHELGAAIVPPYSPQRLAFDYFFTDANPNVLGSTHYDTDGDPDTMPGAALKCYEKNYISAFPAEKTIINVVIISNMRVYRPGSSNALVFMRGRATGVASVARNNVIIVDSSGSLYSSDNSKSLSLSMVCAKDSGSTVVGLQTYAWWSAQAPNVGGNPYLAFIDDCEMLIIERVVSTLPVFQNAD